MRISDHKHRLPDQLCRRCGKPQTGASGIECDAPPRPGDLSVCAYCCYLRTYAADLTLRDLTAAELDDVMRDPELTGLVQRMRRVVHMRQVVRDCPDESPTT